jgi:hypothetical protein
LTSDKNSIIVVSQSNNTMIVPEIRSTTVESNVAEAAQRFKIKASARAFKILSNFYTDPMAAIPRELGANAWDAHVKAGNTAQPFEVHVPNTLEPWFSIRDFGTGLSKEDVYTIYTTYFESTKGGSNDFDGCMGLGSKTPFNYTENFSVTSWFGGVKYTYNCFVDENGGPSILLMAEEEAVEHNGLMVKFAVKQDDINTFVAKIRQSYAAFHVKPKLTGIHDIAYPEIKYVHSGDNWGIRTDGPYNRYSRSCIAMMGNYRYPVDVNLVTGYTDCKGVTKEQKELATTILQNSNLELMFGIGDLDVAPNKETLQYDSDDRTRAAILKAAAKACSDLKEAVLAKIAKPKTRWDAMELYSEVNGYHNNGVYLTNIIGRVNIPVGTDGEVITRSDISYNDVMAKCPGGKFTSTRFELHNLYYNVGADRFKLRETSRWEAGNYVKGMVIFYTNSAGIKRSRIRNYLLTKYKSSDLPHIYLVEDDSANFVDLFAQTDYLGIDRNCLLNVESLPKPPRPPKAPNDPKQKVTDGLYYINIEGMRSNPATARPYITISSKTFDIDPNSTYYYMPIRFTTPIITVDKEEVELSHDQMACLLQYAVEKKLVPDTVKEVMAINVKTRRVMKVGTWINIAEVAYEAFKKNEVAKIEQKLFEFNARIDIVSHCGNFPRMFSPYHDPNATTFFNELESDETKEFFKQLRQVLKNDERRTLTTIEDTLAKLFNIKAKEYKAPEFTAVAVKKVLTEKYLDVFSFAECYAGAGATKLAHLINFIDRQSKKSA